MNSDLNNAVLIGVDIGGTHITVAQIIANTQGITANSKKRHEVDSSASADTIINTWVAAITPLMPSNGNDSWIGIAMPGPFDYDNGISYIKGMNKYESLFGLNIREILANRLGVKPENILFKNDAEAFLHGEIAINTISRQKKCISVTLGTGLGSAYSFDGDTKDANRAINAMHDGIAEDHISSRWVVKRFNELTGDKIAGVKELMDLDNDSVKQTIFTEFGINLGSFLKDFAIAETADEIIIGGSIAKCWSWFIPHVNDHFKGMPVTIRQTALWDDAALIGATYSCLEKITI
jgi:glucokinase